MPNNYFQFKQFRVEQAGASMKVTTEACVLGSSVDTGLSPRHILDIGAGTGLLSLMLAQKFVDPKIDAVEAEPSACQQAQSNFLNSPWAERLTIYHQRIQDFDPGRQYDLIVSNPPFFNNSLLSGSKSANAAKHDEGLSQKELIHSIRRLLAHGGSAYVLYPEREAKLFYDLVLEHGLFVKNKLSIYNKESGLVFRVIQQFSNVQAEYSQEELVIRDAEENYTNEFIRLLGPYYLHL